MTRATARELLQDGLIIALVVLVSAAFYVAYLGFYSDDWAFLAYVKLGGAGQSVQDVFTRAFFTDSILTRPAHALYAAALFLLFGENPLGHHLTNSLVVAASASLFYVVLRELGLGRLPALSAGFLFALMPHYATGRFWFVTFQIPLSAATYFLALLADLKAAARPAGQRWRLRILSMLALTTSVLSYEIFMPFFLLNPLVVWYRERLRAPAAETVWRPIAAFAVLQFSAVIAAGLFKANYTARMIEASAADHFTWFARFVAEAFYTLVFGDFGLRLPIVLFDIVTNHDVWPITAAAAAAGVLIYACLRRIAATPGAEIPGRAASLRLMGVGAFVFVAGYSIFFVTFTAGVAATGMNNRTAMAAAMGIAVGLVGAFAWACSWLSPAARTRIFPALVACFCTSGFIVIDVLGLYWGAAATRQRLVLGEIRRDLPSLPTGATLLLDGVCPYVGPAPVFEAWWDFASALRLTYRDMTLGGDVVTPKLRIREDGIYTRMYGRDIGPYRYDRLFVYNPRQRRLQRLSGPYAARQYFAAANPALDSGCRPSREGEGERLFLPGARRIAYPPQADPG